MSFQDLNIYQKINHVKSEVHFVKKANLNDKLGYNAVSSSMVLAPLAKALVEVGLVLIPECIGMETVGFPVKTKFGESTHYKAHVKMIYTWVNVDKPEEKIVCPWECEGVNTSAFDKAVGAAYTYSEKYFMLKFFNIATDDTDPDFRFDGDDDKKPKQPQTKETPVTAPPAPPEKPKKPVTQTQYEILGVNEKIYNSFASAKEKGNTITEKIDNLKKAFDYYLPKASKPESKKALDDTLEYFTDMVNAGL